MQQDEPRQRRATGRGLRTAGTWLLQARPRLAGLVALSGLLAGLWLLKPAPPAGEEIAIDDRIAGIEEFDVAGVPRTAAGGAASAASGAFLDLDFGPSTASREIPPAEFSRAGYWPHEEGEIHRTSFSTASFGESRAVWLTGTIEETAEPSRTPALWVEQQGLSTP